MKNPAFYAGVPFCMGAYCFLVVLIVEEKMPVIINPRTTKIGHEDEIDPIK